MEKYCMDLENKRLTITKGFEKAVEKGSGEEYELYLKLRAEIPELKVVRKTHKKPQKYCSKSGEVFQCNQYKNLKYENMENFIKHLPNDNKNFLETFYFLRDNAAVIQTSRYTVVRKWFETQFPEFRTNPLHYYNNGVKAVDYNAIIKEVNEKRYSIAQ